jgi:protein BUR2
LPHSHSHTFYGSKLTILSFQNIAATALFLANKTEENCRKTKDIIIAVAKVAQKNPKLIIDEQSKEYWRWRDSILMYEEVMLETLTFDLIVDTPQSQIIEIMKQIGSDHNRPLCRAVWATCNDASLTTLPLQIGAYDIVLASIFFSTIKNGETISDVHGERWWKALKGDEARLIQAVNVINDFYLENPLGKPDNAYQQSPEFNLENTRKPGDGSSTNATPQTDRGTQSPKARLNSTDATVDSKEPDAASAAAEKAARAAPGDSDVALKEAANDPATHPGTNGNTSTLLSPGRKRREDEAEALSVDDREQKRQKMSDDEGQVEG